MPKRRLSARAASAGHGPPALTRQTLRQSTLCTGGTHMGEFTVEFGQGFVHRKVL